MNSTPVSWKPIRPARLSFFLVARPISTGRNPASTSHKSPRWGRLDWNTSARKTIRAAAIRNKSLPAKVFEKQIRIQRGEQMATKGKVLVLVSSGRGLPLKDGKVYRGAGYYLNELTVPVRGSVWRFTICAGISRLGGSFG